jgi:hypothetical protein
MLENPSSLFNTIGTILCLTDSNGISFENILQPLVDALFSRLDYISEYLFLVSGLINCSNFNFFERTILFLIQLHDSILISDFKEILYFLHTSIRKISMGPPLLDVYFNFIFFDYILI